MSDENFRQRLHDGVKKFLRQGKVQSGEWTEFAYVDSHLVGPW